MLSEYITRKAKRATVLTGTVAAAALLIGVGSANALMIDNFGGIGSPIADGAETNPGDTNAGHGRQSILDAAGNVSTSGTASCISPSGGHTGGQAAWCLGGGNFGGTRNLDVNAQNAGNHKVDINIDSSINGRPSGVLQHSSDSSAGADAGITGLRYPDSGTLSPAVNFLVTEDIQTGTNLAGVSTTGLSVGNTIGDVANMGFNVGILSHDLPVSLWTFEINSNFALDVDGDGIADDGGLGGGTSRHAFTYTMDPQLNGCASPGPCLDPTVYFFAFVDFLTVVNATSLASLTDFLSNVNSLSIAFGLPNAQQDITADFVSTGTRLPEPGTLAVMGMGLIGLAFARRRRQQAA